MSYIGSTPTTQNFIAGTDYFNGDGSTVAFTLSRSVNSVNDIEAVINNVVQQPNTAYTVSGTTITFTSAPSAGSSNIYVRYLSTTTQSITPSQGTVSYQSFNSDNQSKLGISFKNRIINGAMVIDQRNAGASVTPSTGNTYTLDRFKATATQASKFTVQQNAASVTPPVGFAYYAGITSSSAYSVLSTDHFEFGQNIEGFNVSDLGWGTANAKTVTLSFWVRSSLTGTFGGTIQNSAQTRSYPFTYTISSANTWELETITIVGDTSGTWLTTNGIGIRATFNLGAGATYSTTANAWAAGEYYAPTGATSIVGTNGATWQITGLQLEVGTQATTFDYRSYGTELALCQRYYGLITNTSTSGEQGYGFGGQLTTGLAGFVIPTPVPMRAEPTITISNLGVSDQIAFTNAATISTIAPTLNGSAIFTTFSAAGAQYRPCYLVSRSTLIGKLTFSAEL